MREIVPGENEVTRLDLPESALHAMQTLDGAIAERSQIVWGEHCSECAYPSCYASCVHYTPRPDLHCRRFDRGIEAVDVRGLGAPLMRIRFLKWGKLLGEGTPLRPRLRTGRHERARQLAGELADLRILPYGLRRGAGRAWTRLEALSAIRDEKARADAFVIECLSPGQREVPFTVTIVPKNPRLLGLFQERVSFGAGYTRHVIEIERIASRIDLTQPYFVQIEPLVESPPETFIFGLVDFVKWARTPLADYAGTEAAAKPTPKAKCVVWDLDETLWDGILAEIGIEGLKLRRPVIEVIRALDQRGILHSIASKNDETEALAALAHFGIDDLFLYPQIGRGPKSESVSRIAKQLDLGVDTFVFVDDQPFERAEVAETLSCVATFPDTNPEALLDHPRFDVPITPEGQRRRLMYKEEIKRQVLFEGGATDYEAFLRTSQIRLHLSLLSEENVTRIYDLSQRTNQINVTGTRYERRAVEELARAPGSKLPIVMQCEDRFGDYGVIGFVLLDPANGLVVDYLMSCRVQRKGVENALFAHLVKLVGERGAVGLRCRYKRTARNQLALELLGELGFRLRETEPGVGFLERDLSQVRGADVVALSAESLP
jgi:FkbH-like protein